MSFEIPKPILAEKQMNALFSFFSVDFSNRIYGVKILTKMQANEYSSQLLPKCYIYLHIFITRFSDFTIETVTG